MKYLDSSLLGLTGRSEGKTDLRQFSNSFEAINWQDRQFTQQ